MENSDYRQEFSQNLRKQLVILGSIVIAIWILEGADWLLGGRLDHLGIIPRQIIGLRGVIAAPFLHHGFAHVAANTIPFVILGWLVLLRGPRVFLFVALTSILIGGLATWLLGPGSSLHIGASGLVFGLFGYLLTRGIFERSWQSIAGSILVLLIYGGMLTGLLPGAPWISWQMHLFGFAGGVVAAYWLARPVQRSARYLKL